MPKAERSYYVYILTNRSGTLYAGVTSDLARRVSEHMNRATPGFTSRYKIDRLVYVEVTGNILDALQREKQIKAWTRKKRVDLINSVNPKWRDLSEELLDSDAALDSLDSSLRSE